MNTKKNNIPFSSVNINTNTEHTNEKSEVDSAFKNIENTLKMKKIDENDYKEVKPEKKQVITQKKDETIQAIKKEIVMIKHMRKSAKIAIALIIIAIVLISSSIYYNNNFLNNPKVIAKKAIKNLGTEVVELLDISNKSTLIGENYSINSTITSRVDTTKEDYKHLFNNLKNSTTTYTINHDLKNKQFQLTQKSIVNGNVITDDKYYITNSTDYYYIKDFTKEYVNNGNNTYFETISNKHTIKNNAKYLFNFIYNNITDSIDKEEYTIQNTTTLINNEKTKVKETTLELDSKRIKELLNAQLKQLKKDTRSFNILNSIIDNFEEYKLPKDLVNKKTKATIKVYTNGLLNDVLKYEVKTDEKTIIYEVEQKTITVLDKDNKTLNIIKFKKNNKLLEVSLYDSNNEKIGYMEYDNNTNRKYIKVEYEKDDTNYNYEIIYKVSNKKSNSYESKTTINIDIKESNVNTYKGSIEINSKINNKPKIEINIEDEIFAKDLTDEQLEQRKDLLKNRLNKAL